MNTRLYMKLNDIKVHSPGSGLQQHHHPVDTPADPMKGKQISTTGQQHCKHN
jgi:hypothetical protein